MTDAPARFSLYVAGASPNSVTALANLRTALEGHPEGRVIVEVIDILQHPERAIEDRVLVTPMLVRFAPLPERRILGNLRDRSALLAVLALPSAEER